MNGFLRTRGYVTWMVCACARVYDGDVEDASASGEAERWSGDATMMEKIGSRRPSSSSSSSSYLSVCVLPACVARVKLTLELFSFV